MFNFSVPSFFHNHCTNSSMGPWENFPLCVLQPVGPCLLSLQVCLAWRQGWFPWNTMPSSAETTTVLCHSTHMLDTEWHLNPQPGLGAHQLPLTIALPWLSQELCFAACYASCCFLKLFSFLLPLCFCSFTSLSFPWTLPHSLSLTLLCCQNPVCHQEPRRVATHTPVPLDHCSRKGLLLGETSSTSWLLLWGHFLPADTRSKRCLMRRTGNMNLGLEF